MPCLFTCLCSTLPTFTTAVGMMLAVPPACVCAEKLDSQANDVRKCASHDRSAITMVDANTRFVLLYIARKQTRICNYIVSCRQHAADEPLSVCSFSGRAAFHHGWPFACSGVHPVSRPVVSMLQVRAACT